jgi:hypothetical protein
MSEKDIDNLFSRFGRINFAGLSKAENGENIGIVLFDQREDAQKAVQAIDGKVIDGSGIPIQMNL